jgi:OPT family oligopeptide transporter
VSLLPSVEPNVPSNYCTVYYGRDITRQLRSSLKDETDIHARLMRAYPEVPHWWYLAIFAFSLISGIVIIEKYHTDLPVWVFLFCIFCSFLFVIPVGLILAVTNHTINLNILSEFLAGYLIPGLPIPVMIYKTYGTIITRQAVQFAGDLKLGHYMKVPPRIMYTAQTFATVVNCFVVIIVQRWALANIPGVCTPHQPNHFTCPNSVTFAQAGLLYGGVGPGRLFSTHSM